MALILACSRKPSLDKVLVEWEEAFVDYSVACATGEMSWGLKVRAAFTDGPVLICSGKNTPTVQDGKNAAFAIRYARELGEHEIAETAAMRLEFLTEELRAGSRGWIMESS